MNTTAPPAISPERSSSREVPISGQVSQVTGDGVFSDLVNLLLPSSLYSTELSNNNNSCKSTPVTSKEVFQESESPELKAKRVARRVSSRRKECPGCGQVSLCPGQVCCERCVRAQKQLLALASNNTMERDKLTILTPIELAAEDTIELCQEMKCSMKKLRSLVNYIKDSATAREAFKKILVDACVDPLSIIQGTSNRWFFKYSEAHRALLLKDHINTFFEEFETPDTLDPIEEYDWEMIVVYENAMRILVEAGKMFEGELYPTASSVIPFLYTVFEDLDTLKDKVEGAAKVFVTKLLSNLKSNKRFPDGYKRVVPYNCLTLLDIRHADLYFTKDELEKTVHDLCIAKVYDEDLVQSGEEGGVAAVVPVPVHPDPTQQEDCQQQRDSFTRIRAQLLAAKNIEVQNQPNAGAGRIPFKERLDKELERFLKWRGQVPVDENPNIWWRKYHADYPLLAKFWMAHSSFPATSTSSERVFNMDGLILVPRR